MVDTDLLTEADQAFVASMQAIDAEVDASVKEQSAKLAALDETFLAKVNEHLNSPLKMEDARNPQTT